jgi:epsilon-lactone hydrolase
MKPWLFSALLGCAAVFAVGPSFADQPAHVDGDATIHVPAFLLPESSFLDQAAHADVKPSPADQKKDATAWAACPPLEQADAAQASAIRKCEVGAFHGSSPYRRLHDRYGVATVRQEIGGVQTEVFVPAGGVTARNHGRVLIDLHGGAFLGGWRINSDYESTPVAALGRIKVISVDYREAPEHGFPAASEDVAAVYKALLERYKPASIGIYGCSAGALLTAEAIAWFEAKGLPLPGAVAMLCGGASYWSDGDSGYLGRAIYGNGVVFGGADENPYFRGTTASDVLAFPVRSAAIMRRFPPSLLITATRDPSLSSAAYTHSLLVAEGVEAELHVWEGLGHGFFYDTGLPESRAAYGVIVRFFDTHLAVERPVTERRFDSR